MVRVFITLFLALCMPTFAHAEEHLNRRDAYLLIWDSIRRPAYETTQVDAFVDVPVDSIGGLEITWSKRRGILNPDSEYFYPDGDVYLSDALLWLYRTRNVNELDQLQVENLPTLVERYPITDFTENRIIATREELLELMQKLDTMLKDEVHEISFYADDFHGEGTAFGETFDMNALTAAHRSFPQDTLVRVTNVENNESVVVRINDRGPYVHGRDMDLSKAAFEKISHSGAGVAEARFERLGDVDLVSTCSNQTRRYQRRITRDVRFHRGVPHDFEVGNQLALGSNRWFVVRGITYPDGTFVPFQDYVAPEERFLFVPNETGEYRFLLGTVEGRKREMTMNVGECGS